VISLTPS